MRATDWSRVISISHRALAQLLSSRLYLLVVPARIERLRLPVHDFMALSPSDPLRKVNNLAAGQFTTLFHGYTEALLPYKPFGGMLYVNPIPGELPWDEAAAYQREVILNAIERSRGTLPRFAVFSLSQIALCIHLGFILSDRLEVLWFQHDRDRKSWKWAEDVHDADTNIKVSGLPKKIVEGKREVIIRVSLSASISRKATRNVVGGRPVEIDLSISDPDVMWLKSRDQIMILGQKFRNVLKAIERNIPDCPRIHLFYAGPTGGAIVLGQQINPRTHPPVELYEYSRQATVQHQRALTLR